MIKTTQNVLPDGYTELEYIESNGNQWIYTNVKLQPTLGFEIKYKYPSDAGGVILGFYNPGSVSYYCTRMETATLYLCNLNILAAHQTMSKLFL